MNGLLHQRVTVSAVGAAGTAARPRRRPRRALVARALGLLGILGFAGFTAALGWAWFAGWRLEVVQTPSMEPVVPKNALAVVVPTNARSVHVGDVVAYEDPQNPSRRILHRVIDVVRQGDGLFFRTQGDANTVADPLLVPANRVEARMIIDIPRAGALLRSLRPPTSYLVLTGLPLMLWAIQSARTARRGRDATSRMKTPEAPAVEAEPQNVSDDLFARAPRLRRLRHSVAYTLDPLPVGAGVDDLIPVRVPTASPAAAGIDDLLPHLVSVNTPTREVVD